MKKRENLKSFGFILPSFLGVLFFVLIPFADVVKRSFADVTGNTFAGLLNYRLLAENRAFHLALKNTGRFMMVCVPLVLGISLGFANIIYFWETGLMRKLSLLPMAVPGASLVFLWQVLFHRYGFINTLFGTTADWLHSGYAFGVLVLSFLWKNTGYYVILWLAGMEGIPISRYEAASADGAGPWQTFRYITLPGLKPAASAAAVLALTGCFKSYREAYLLAGEYPEESIYMIPHLFSHWFRELSLGKMSACAVVMVLIFGALVWPFRKKRRCF